MDLEPWEAKERGSEGNLLYRSCRLFAQRGIACWLLSFGFDNFSQARRSYYLFFNYLFFNYLYRLPVCTYSERG